MAVTLPENPRFINNWEEKVWRALDEQLGPDDLIVVGQRVTDHTKDHEIDFVVAIEGAGVICVEVKGGNVWHDGNTWRQSTADGPKAINPVEQARGGCYALRSFVEGDLRWNSALAALGPRRSPSGCKARPGLRAAGMSALEGDGQVGATGSCRVCAPCSSTRRRPIRS